MLRPTAIIMKTSMITAVLTLGNCLITGTLVGRRFEVERIEGHARERRRARTRPARHAAGLPDLVELAPGGAAEVVPVAAGRHQAPSGVRSPSRPSGRNTRIAIRMPNTIERVQSPPGVPIARPSL